LNLIEQHKALIITFLLAGIVVLGLFSIHIKQQSRLITESYYLLEPEEEKTEEELKKIEELEKFSTDKAFNEDQEFKEMMRNFKTVSSNDFERTQKARENAKAEFVQEEEALNATHTNDKTYALKSEETDSYKKLQNELNKRIENKKQADKHSKAKSSLTYSLVGRTLTYYETPRYLCEYGGKIVVTIRVNADGNVFDAYINGASNSDNQCLTDHAIAYAKSVQFNTSSQTDQLGTITFSFKGKH